MFRLLTVLCMLVLFVNSALAYPTVGRSRAVSVSRAGGGLFAGVGARRAARVAARSNRSVSFSRSVSSGNSFSAPAACGSNGCNMNTMNVQQPANLTFTVPSAPSASSAAGGGAASSAAGGGGAPQTFTVPNPNFQQQAPQAPAPQNSNEEQPGPKGASQLDPLRR